jgi:hypothetical protein
VKRVAIRIVPKTKAMIYDFLSFDFGRLFCLNRLRYGVSIKRKLMIGMMFINMIDYLIVPEEDVVPVEVAFTEGVLGALLT